MGQETILELVGKVLVQVEQGGDYFSFYTSTHEYTLHHEQDCCENVWLDDVCGNIYDLLGSTITVAEEVSNTESSVLERLLRLEDKDDSTTWTFYKIDTAKGGITLRFCGSSNGYYSESVDFSVTKIKA